MPPAHVPSSIVLAAADGLAVSLPRRVPHLQLERRQQRVDGQRPLVHWHIRQLRLQHRVLHALRGGGAQSGVRKAAGRRPAARAGWTQAAGGGGGGGGGGVQQARTSGCLRHTAKIISSTFLVDMAAVVHPPAREHCWRALRPADGLARLLR